MIEPPLPSKSMNALDWCVKVWRYVRATAPKAGPGIRMVETPSGTIISVAPAGGNVSSPLLPLTVAGGTAADKIQVVPGHVNGVMPTLAATALNADPAPEITLTAAETHVWCKAVVVHGTSASYTIETSTSSTPPAGASISGTGYTSYHRLGQCAMTGSGDTAVVAISNSQGGNLGVNSFGNINLWWRQ